MPIIMLNSNIIIINPPNATNSLVGNIFAHIDTVPNIKNVINIFTTSNDMFKYIIFDINGWLIIPSKNDNAKNETVLDIKPDITSKTKNKNNILITSGAINSTVNIVGIKTPK